MKTVWGKEYEVKGTYVNNYTKIGVKHLECGLEYDTLPADFLKGRGCMGCYRKSRRKTNKEWIKEVIELGKNEYEPLEKYKGDGVNIEIRHKACGQIYKVKPNNFINGTRCPYCRESKGEKTIFKYLKDNDIEFETQKGFKGLKHIKPLLYDFYLPNINILIEYQGEQHYRPIEYFGGLEAFKEQVIKDNIKRDFAKINGVELVELPYTLGTGEELINKLEKTLKNYSVT